MHKCACVLGPGHARASTTHYKGIWVRFEALHSSFYSSSSSRVLMFFLFSFVCLKSTFGCYFFFIFIKQNMYNFFEGLLTSENVSPSGQNKPWTQAAIRVISDLLVMVRISAGSPNSKGGS